MESRLGGTYPEPGSEREKEFEESMSVYMKCHLREF